MAASTNVVGLVTMIHAHHTGGSSTKKRRRFVIQIADAVNGLTVGGGTNKINTADLGLGLTYIDEVAMGVLYTTATPATITNIIPAAASADGSFIGLNSSAASFNIGDVSISSSQTLQLTFYGF